MRGGSGEGGERWNENTKKTDAVVKQVLCLFVRIVSPQGERERESGGGGGGGGGGGEGL